MTTGKRVKVAIIPDRMLQRSEPVVIKLYNQNMLLIKKLIKQI